MEKIAEKILELLDEIDYIDLFGNIYDEIKNINRNGNLKNSFHDLLLTLEDDTNYVLNGDSSFDKIIELLKTW